MPPKLTVLATAAPVSTRSRASPPASSVTSPSPTLPPLPALPSPAEETSELSNRIRDIIARISREPTEIAPNIPRQHKVRTVSLVDADEHDESLAPSTTTPEPVQITTPMKKSTKGRKKGTPNYGDHEIKYMTAVVAELAPDGSHEWGEVVRRVNSRFNYGRDIKSVKAKFIQLLKQSKKKPSGATNVPQWVRNVRAAEEAMNKKTASDLIGKPSNRNGYTSDDLTNSADELEDDNDIDDDGDDDIGYDDADDEPMYDGSGSMQYSSASADYYSQQQMTIDTNAVADNEHIDNINVQSDSQQPSPTDMQPSMPVNNQSASNNPIPPRVNSPSSVASSVLEFDTATARKRSHQQASPQNTQIPALKSKQARKDSLIPSGMSSRSSPKTRITDPYQFMMSMMVQQTLRDDARATASALRETQREKEKSEREQTRMERELALKAERDKRELDLLTAKLEREKKREEEREQERKDREEERKAERQERKHQMDMLMLMLGKNPSQLPMTSTNPVTEK